MHMILRKFMTACRNPKLVADLIGGIWVNTLWTYAEQNRLLSTWQNPSARSTMDNILFDGAFDFWTNHVYLKEKDPDKREVLKDICMAGASGVNWAEAYDQRPIDRNEICGDLKFDQACPWMSVMEQWLEKFSDTASFLQIGCSSGRETAYFAQQFPHVKFLGTDIDEQIIRRAQSAYSMDNVSFLVTRAHEISTILPHANPLIVYSSGSLQYVQPEHLALVFQIVKNRGASIILGEPWQEAGKQIGSHLSRWRGSFSFSHNYRAYAENAGLTVIKDEIIQPYLDSNSQHFFTRHYFLHAQA